MTVQSVVVAHIDRTREVLPIAVESGAHHVFIDRGEFGEWPNHRRAMAWAADQDASHTLILQDDAVPIVDFRTHLERAAGERPDDMIGLYVGQQRPQAARVTKGVSTADTLGASWLTAPRLFWGVATIVPTQHLPALIARMDADPQRQYDRKLGTAWTRLTGRPVVYTWPSLVDHADLPQITSDHAPRPVGRIAHRVGVPNWGSVEVQI